MKNNAKSVYEVDRLVAEAKKNLRNYFVKTIIAAVVLTLSILVIVLFGLYIPVFVGGVILACASAFMCYKWLKQIVFTDYSSVCGEIIDVNKEIKIVSTTGVGGINPFGTRRYDHYRKNEIRLSVFVKDGEKVHGCLLKDVTEEHTKYYEAKGEVIHIWGTHFPVKLEIGDEKWLCPVCGEFNANEEKICTRCKKKIIK